VRVKNPYAKSSPEGSAEFEGAIGHPDLSRKKTDASRNKGARSSQ
jgi:hypothetical protein